MELTIKMVIIGCDIYIALRYPKKDNMCSCVTVSEPCIVIYMCKRNQQKCTLFALMISFNFTYLLI